MIRFNVPPNPDISERAKKEHEAGKKAADETNNDLLIEEFNELATCIQRYEIKLSEYRQLEVGPDIKLIDTIYTPPKEAEELFVYLFDYLEEIVEPSGILHSMLYSKKTFSKETVDIVNEITPLIAGGIHLIWWHINTLPNDKLNASRDFIIQTTDDLNIAILDYNIGKENKLYTFGEALEKFTGYGVALKD